MHAINYDDVYLDYDGWDTAYYPEDTRYTGTVVEFDEMTQKILLSISEWKDGLQDGIERCWDNQGRLESETQMAFNFAHGESRTWYPNGQIKDWAILEYDYVLVSIDWDENGNIVTHIVFDENHPKDEREKHKAEVLQLRRLEYQRPLPPPLRNAPDGKLFIPVNYDELLDKYKYLQKMIEHDS